MQTSWQSLREDWLGWCDERNPCSSLCSEHKPCRCREVCPQGSVWGCFWGAGGRHPIAELSFNFHCANLLFKDTDTFVTNVLDLISLQCTDFPFEHFQALYWFVYFKSRFCPHWSFTAPAVRSSLRGADWLQWSRLLFVRSEWLTFCYFSFSLFNDFSWLGF